MQKTLPIWEIHSPIIDHLSRGNRLVIVAPTGSGKTTQTPQMLLDSGLAGGGRIVVLQPRRVAARTVAARVAWERGSRLGVEVGYQVRFDDQTSLGTRISFVTEGILLRQLQQDRALNGVSVVVFDEFHERNLLSDVGLAIVKELQRAVRPDLKLLVMSATLEAEPVAKYLSEPEAPCPVLVSEGQSFPVEVRYLKQSDARPAHELAADAVERVIRAGEPGDILVFMPGMGEIHAALNACRAMDVSERVALIPLHGELQPEEQDMAFAPNPLRKIVAATNVAETSVTIDGIRHVVDGGLARVARYDSERGIQTLAVEEISRASAEQRKGRAGRTAPGVCYRLWTESGHLNRPERNTPEIQRSDLAEVVLLLHSLGIRRAAEFDWLDKPDPQAVERAEELLRTLGALKDSEERGADLTPVGWQMLRLPMHPRYSRMLVEASRYDCVPAAALCAALVSGRDLLQRVGRDDRHVAEARELFEASQDSDFHTLMRAWQFAVNNHFNMASCRRYGIHAQAARQIEQTFQQILALAKSIKPEVAAAGAVPQTQGGAEDPLFRCILSGFIDQLCARRDTGSLECDMAGGRQGTLMRESVVQNAKLFVAASIREVPGRGSSPLTLLGLATAVKKEWITERFSDQLTERLEHWYDRAHKRVAALRIVRFRDLVIEASHQRDVDPEASGRALADAHRKGSFELPLFNHEVRQFIARVSLVRAAMPELEFPGFDEEAIRTRLAFAFSGMTLAREAQAAPLRDAFVGHLAPEQAAWLEELAPGSIRWPDGRKIKLLYPEETDDKSGAPQPPEAQVKLHECFTLQEHPRVIEGRVPVRLWLCGPDGKRIESTQDWPAFRKNSYPKLKPTLQKKYVGIGWL